MPDTMLSTINTFLLVFTKVRDNYHTTRFADEETQLRENKWLPQGYTNIKDRSVTQLF